MTDITDNFLSTKIHPATLLGHIFRFQRSNFESVYEKTESQIDTKCIYHGIKDNLISYRVIIIQALIYNNVEHYIEKNGYRFKRSWNKINCQNYSDFYYFIVYNI